MAYRLTCPCGDTIRGGDEEFLDEVRGHLRANHPGHEYSDDEIMMLAVKVPDQPASN